MITLTDHVCGMCQHLNRYGRTFHGKCSDRVRELDREIAQRVQERRYKSLPYLNQQRDDALSRMRNIEQGRLDVNYLQHKHKETRHVQKDSKR